MEVKIVDKESNIITNTVVDPHHGGANSWGLYNGEFYHKGTGCVTWTRVKKISITPARLKVLAGLL